jgi:hypothetical protein
MPVGQAATVNLIAPSDAQEEGTEEKTTCDRRPGRSHVVIACPAFPSPPHIVPLINKTGEIDGWAKSALALELPPHVAT